MKPIFYSRADCQLQARIYYERTHALELAAIELPYARNKLRLAAKEDRMQAQMWAQAADNNGTYMVDEFIKEIRSKITREIYGHKRCVMKKPQPTEAGR